MKHLRLCLSSILIDRCSHARLTTIPPEAASAIFISSDLSVEQTAAHRHGTAACSPTSTEHVKILLKLWARASGHAQGDTSTLTMHTCKMHATQGPVSCR